jgi:uncharacterized protein
MVTYKTPGVYVEEISTLPPSVAAVSTAIPAFMGYTQKAGNTVARISTLLEYKTIFGEAQASTFKATTHENEDSGQHELDQVERVVSADEAQFMMYYALSLFFSNGGESCYIVSIGDYSATPAKEDFIAGLAELEKEDEPTLILLTDAILLGSDDYYTVCQAALDQCKKLGDRFCILDVKDGNWKIFRDLETNKTGIGTKNLLYGAAYHPYLQTSLNYQYKEEQVTIEGGAADSTPATWLKAYDENGIVVSYQGNPGDEPKVKIIGGDADNAVSFSISATNVLTIDDVDGKTGSQVVEAWTTWTGTNADQGFAITINGTGGGDVPHTSNRNDELAAQTAPPTAGESLASIKDKETALYNQIKTALSRQRVVLPPSPAVAGVYASVDRERGVWKAPANISISAVIGPVLKITHEDQENLNVDPTAGKSINAIRAFTGKGTLVWGARTLAGNDNEWRYVNVRRLFNMIEESTQKATGFAVFEPNDATTWLKVKAMIESFLYGLWEQGALAGPTPEAAYFVNVGLGKTMTNQDILEGRMVVEIGVAAVRPAEFIILRFSHKMQEA